MALNFITIRPQIVLADIEQKIMAAFQRSGSIDSKSVNAEVLGSKGGLTGLVRSFAEKEDAESRMGCTWSANC